MVLTLMNAQAIHVAMEHVIMASAQISGHAHVMLVGQVKLVRQTSMSALRILVPMVFVRMGQAQMNGGVCVIQGGQQLIVILTLVSSNNLLQNKRNTYVLLQTNVPPAHAQMVYVLMALELTSGPAYAMLDGQVLLVTQTLMNAHQVRVQMEFVLMEQELINGLAFAIQDGLESIATLILVCELSFSAKG